MTDTSLALYVPYFFPYIQFLFLRALFSRKATTARAIDPPSNSTSPRNVETIVSLSLKYLITTPRYWPISTNLLLIVIVSVVVVLTLLLLLLKWFILKLLNTTSSSNDTATDISTKTKSTTIYAAIGFITNTTMTNGSSTTADNISTNTITFLMLLIIKLLLPLLLVLLVPKLQLLQILILQIYFLIFMPAFVISVFSAIFFIPVFFSNSFYFLPFMHFQQFLLSLFRLFWCLHFQQCFDILFCILLAIFLVIFSFSHFFIFNKWIEIPISFCHFCTFSNFSKWITAFSF